MKTFTQIVAICTQIVPLIIGLSFSFIVVPTFGQITNKPGFVLEHERDISAEQSGPHSGLGTTTGYSFFSKVSGLKMIFRKRVMHPGSSIGYHLQTEDEIYYVVSGKGEMKMNGDLIPMIAGDAILTRPGSSHGLTQKGKDDLVIIISYEQK